MITNKVKEAREKVADWYIDNAKAIRIENAYASHVTEEEKDDILQSSILYGQEIRKGLHDNNVTIRQRIHYEMTGGCKKMLP